MRRLMRETGGDVAFVLLVMVALAAVLAAGMVLVLAERSVLLESQRFSTLSEDARAMEAYASAVSRMAGGAVIRESVTRGNATLGEHFVEKALEQESLLAQSRGFYERIATPGAVSFRATSEGFALRISDIPLTLVHEQNRLQRNVSLTIAFDGQGNVMRE